MKGYRKLIALFFCIVAAMWGAIYMNDTVFISFTAMLGTGLGIFAYSNLKEYKYTGEDEAI
jgi:hypothetical protein